MRAPGHQPQRVRSVDRLPAVALAAFVGLVGCERSGEPGAAESPPSGARQRVNAVAAEPKPHADPRALCDVHSEQGEGARFEWPALAGKAPELASGRWAWVNFWATWCKPCVEELPRLRRWQGTLRDRVGFYFVSADDSDQVIESYRERHPALEKTARLADPDKLPQWLESLGVASAALPVHVLVAPDGRIVCVRTSGVEDSDFSAVEALLDLPRR